VKVTWASLLLFTCCCPPLLSNTPRPGQEHAAALVEQVTGKEIKGAIGIVWLDDPEKLNCDHLHDSWIGTDGVCYQGKADDYRALDRPINGQWQITVSWAPTMNHVSETSLVHELVHVVHRRRDHFYEGFGNGGHVDQVNSKLRDMGY
jgi:hypothetical protein